MFSVVFTCEWCDKEEKTPEKAWTFKQIVPFFGRTFGSKNTTWDDSRFCDAHCEKAHKMALDCAKAKAEDIQMETFEALKGSTVGNLRGVWMDLRGREWPLVSAGAKK